MYGSGRGVDVGVVERGREVEVEKDEDGRPSAGLRVAAILFVLIMRTADARSVSFSKSCIWSNVS